MSPKLGQRAFDDEGHHQGAPERDARYANIAHEQVQPGKVKLSTHTHTYSTDIHTHAQKQKLIVD